MLQLGQGTALGLFVIFLVTSVIITVIIIKIILSGKKKKCDVCSPVEHGDILICEKCGNEVNLT